MALVKNPTTVSGCFGISPKKLEQLKVLNATLAIDTKLFIDPLLFPYSVHREINTVAVQHYREHFERVVKFLSITSVKGDVAWRSAKNLLQFHEVRGTCLGYGAATIQGSGFGIQLTERILLVGKEIVDLGITDPDLFPAMALFEDDIGPDRISDMATNVAHRALISFNKRILNELGLKGERFILLGVQGSFLQNPFQRRRTPAIFVPTDILRPLPIAMDWDDIADAASKTEAIRRCVNEHIGHIWAAKTRRDKEELKSEALASKDAFKVLLDAIHSVAPKAYKVSKDPDGLIKWAEIGKQFATIFPMNLKKLSHPSDLDSLFSLVKKIVSQFQYLVEHKGLNKELYKDDGRPRHEATAQRLFFTVAYSYCEANDVDVSPEVDTGTGKVDFKLSSGFSAKVLVEIKLSTNPKVVHGFGVQLETYKSSESTARAFYVVIDVGRMGKKDQQLLKVQNATTTMGRALSELVIVDGILRASASKREE